MFERAMQNCTTLTTNLFAFFVFVYVSRAYHIVICKHLYSKDGKRNVFVSFTVRIQLRVWNGIRSHFHYRFFFLAQRTFLY